MKPLPTFFLPVFALILFTLPAAVQAETPYDTATARVVDALKTAYTSADFQFSQGEGGLYATVNNATLLVQPDGVCPKGDPDAPQDPPLCALFSFTYPVGEGGRYPAEGFDPGRIRNEALLKALYGQNRGEVAKNCARVNFLGERVPFNARHGAAEALARVSARLEPQVASNPELKSYIFPLGGTSHWRVINGSTRLSAHSFAIAIDLNVEKGLYWGLEPCKESAKLRRVRQNYPQAIVDAFEAEGFIWGGKWSAFDFMHFEYRPEMRALRRLLP